MASPVAKYGDRRELARVEPVRIARLGQQLFRFRGIVQIGLDRQRVLEALEHDVAVGPGSAKRIGVAERLSVNREARGLAHALVCKR